jgi:two-component system sensor histidine kinase CreC
VPEADRARFVASIRAQGERMAQMVDKLLALAAVEHRQEIGQPQRIEADALLHEAVDALAQRAQAAWVELRVDAPTGAVLSGDPFLLRQALVNLLDNALDFAPRGSAVEARALRDDRRIRFEIADRGPGVPDYAREHVFVRFYSLPRPGGGSRSSGLGLPFVAQVAQLHGGRVALHEREGGGTVAELSIPST